MSKIRETPISNCERKFVLKCLSEYLRIDGRSFDEFRDLKIEFGKDWGCCHVTLGKTSVLAQVSCEVQQPKSTRPSEGILNINLELTPMGAPNFEAGRQSDVSIQLNRLLEKCLKDSKAIDLESLCIKLNEKVWAFRVDINILNYEGNILDCASVAALAALAHFRRPDVTTDGEEIIVHTYTQRDPIPTSIHHYPVCVSYGIFNNGEVILADTTLLEEGVAEGQLIYSLNAYKELCGLHLGGNVLMGIDQILSTTTKATNRANLVIQLIKDEIKNDAQLRQEQKLKGFQLMLDVDKELDKLMVNEADDDWITNSKRWTKSAKDPLPEVPVQAEIQSISKGSALLLPKDENDDASWEDTSEEESDASVQEIVDKSAKEVITVDSDSEEDVVIVLNADNKTNKKKKILK